MRKRALKMKIICKIQQRFVFLAKKRIILWQNSTDLLNNRPSLSLSVSLILSLFLSLSLSLSLYIYIYIIYIYTIGLVDRLLANVLENLGEITDRIISKTKKWYLIPPETCFSVHIMRFGSEVKWSNPGKGVVPTPTPRCSSY